MSLLHSLFHHISFQQADPLGDGLREEIEAEQLEPEAIRLYEDESQLEQRWQEIQEDVKKDPDWFHFTEEE